MSAAAHPTATDKRAEHNPSTGSGAGVGHSEPPAEVHPAPHSHSHSHSHHHDHSHGGGHKHHHHPKAPAAATVTDAVTAYGEGEEPWHARGLWQKPRLWRDWGDIKKEDHRKISWSELFFDLIYVTLIARLGESLRAGELNFGEYVLYFLNNFFFWMTSTQYATRFNSDDLYHKLFFGVYMMFVFGMGMHVKGGTDGPHGGGFCVSAAAIRGIVAFTYFRIAWHIPRARVSALASASANVVMMGVWIIPIFMPASKRLPWFIVSLLIAIFHGPIIANLLPKKHGLPMHLEHFIERIGLFVIIVMGESVNGMTLEPSDLTQTHLHLYAGGIFGFICVLSVKFLYFDVDVKSLDDHALRYKGRNGMLWMYGHAVLTCALAVVGSGLLLICEAENGGGDAATEPKSGESGELSEGESGQTITTGRWYLIGGTVACLCMFTFFRVLHRPLTDEIPARLDMLNLIFHCQLGAQMVFAVLLVLCNQFADISNIGLLTVVATGSVILVALNFADEVFLNWWNGQQNVTSCTGPAAGGVVGTVPATHLTDAEDAASKQALLPHGATVAVVPASGSGKASYGSISGDSVPALTSSGSSAVAPVPHAGAINSGQSMTLSAEAAAHIAAGGAVPFGGGVPLSSNH